MIKRLLLVMLVTLGILLLALAGNTLRQRSQQVVAARATPIAVNAAQAAQHLAGALRFRTIASADDSAHHLDQFLQLHDYLQQTYPHLHAVTNREVIGQTSLLFRWQGSDPAARPVLWMAHQDVVPIAAGTEADWQVPPFDGVVRDGYVWGRGAWDNKGNLIAMLEALERLAIDGFRPRQTIYVVSGADEEVGGQRGAAAIAALLQTRGVQPDYVLDEGLLITQGMMAGLHQPAALIGIAEKGYATFHLQLRGAPGHSSMPPPTTLIGDMAAALTRLERQPLPARVSGVAQQMLSTLAPEMSLTNRVLLSNLWLTAPLVGSQLQKQPSTNAMLRSTAAVTIIAGGNKDNVLPGVVDATVNFRLLPGDTQATVLAHLQRALGNHAIQITAAPGNSEAAPIADTAAPGYQRLQRTVRALFTDTLVAPGLMIGATDARFFVPLTGNVYRFSPVRAGPTDLARFHGTNERIAVTNLVEMIQFYHLLLQQAG